jgi:integrase
MKLTDVNVKKIEVPIDEKTSEPKGDHIAWDDQLKGFGFRIRRGKNGVRRTWVIQWKNSISQGRESLDASKVGADAARRTAKQWLGKAAAGEDPRGDRKAREAGTFKAAAADFIKHQKEKGKRASTIYASELYLLKYCKPLHPLRLNSEGIDRAEVSKLLKAIKTAHGPVSADRARAALSSMFAWAIRDGGAATGFNNPVADTNTHSDGGSKGRALKDVELASIWNAADNKTDFGRIMRLLILTGCRRNEIAKLEWQEVDDELISIPGSRTKNHLQFDVPLTPLARSLIGPRPDKPRKYVFGRYSSSKGFGGFSKAKAELDAKLGDAVADWRLHDIRHTVSTGMHEKIGVQPHVVEAVLNHISGAKAGVAGRYNHAAYNPQKRDALERWENHVTVLAAKASGANVTDEYMKRLRERA